MMIGKSLWNTMTFLNDAVVRVAEGSYSRTVSRNRCQSCAADISEIVTRRRIKRDRICCVVTAWVEVIFEEGLHRVGGSEIGPAQAVLERQFFVYLPAILAIQLELMETEGPEEDSVALLQFVVVTSKNIAQVVSGVIRVGCTRAEVDKGRVVPTRLLSGLVVVEEHPEFHGMRSGDLGNIVRPGEHSRLAVPT